MFVIVDIITILLSVFLKLVSFSLLLFNLTITVWCGYFCFILITVTVRIVLITLVIIMIRAIIVIIQIILMAPIATRSSNL